MGLTGNQGFHGGGGSEIYIRPNSQDGTWLKRPLKGENSYTFDVTDISMITTKEVWDTETPSTPTPEHSRPTVFKDQDGGNTRGMSNTAREDGHSRR